MIVETEVCRTWIQDIGTKKNLAWRWNGQSDESLFFLNFVAAAWVCAIDTERNVINTHTRYNIHICTIFVRIIPPSQAYRLSYWIKKTKESWSWTQATRRSRWQDSFIATSRRVEYWDFISQVDRSRYWVHKQTDIHSHEQNLKMKSVVHARYILHSRCGGGEWWDSELSPVGT